jgi:hypothetical protein
MNKSSVASHKPMHAARNANTNTLQNAEVDRLNDQSYQAAQQGKTFSAGAADNSGMGSSGMSSPSPSDTSGSGYVSGSGSIAQPGGGKM